MGDKKIAMKSQGMNLMNRDGFKQGGHFVFTCYVGGDTAVSIDSLKKPVLYGNTEIACKTLSQEKGRKAYNHDHVDLIVFIFLTLNCDRSHTLM